MLITMVGWGFDRPTKTFVTDRVTPERLESLIHAVIALGPRIVQMRIAGLSSEQYLEVRAHLAAGSRLTVEDSLERPSRVR